MSSDWCISGPRLWTSWHSQFYKAQPSRQSHIRLCELHPWYNHSISTLICLVATGRLLFLCETRNREGERGRAMTLLQPSVTSWNREVWKLPWAIAKELTVHVYTTWSFRRRKCWGMRVWSCTGSKVETLFPWSRMGSKTAMHICVATLKHLICSENIRRPVCNQLHYKLYLPPGRFKVRNVTRDNRNVTP